MKMTRRQFLGTSLATAALAACGGGDDGGGGGSNTTDAPASTKSCVDNGTTATISANHGHVIMVTAADVTAGVDKTYDIMGTAGHTHSVTLTAADFASLKSNPNGNVMETSTTAQSHNHTITIFCV